jgi:hypothetical protein
MKRVNRATTALIASRRQAVHLFLALGLTASFLPSTVRADSAAIPTTAISLKNKELPAIDLLFNGQPIDPDTAVDLRNKGTDLARLNPQPSDVWQDSAYSASNADQQGYPQAGARLTFHSIMPQNPEGWFRSQVLYGDQVFRLQIGLNTHQALMRAALLRKLGFAVQSPTWMSKMTLAFADKASKDQFIGQISLQAGLVDHTRWVIGNDDKKNEIVLQDVMLEPAQIIVPTSFYLGNLNATHIKDRRVLRSLIVPFVLVDVPESVNMFSWEVGQIVNGSVVLTHKYADAFRETSYDDIRWMLARLGRLTRNDFKEVVDAGRYPSDIGAVILEKTIARRNGLLSLFKMSELADLFSANAQSLAVNTEVSVGYVDKGKVTREHYDGYALRFTHGDPQSPLRKDDITRFIKIEAISAAIKQATTQLSDQLQFWKMSDILARRSEDLRNDFMNHMKTNPTQPYNQPTSTWSGFTGGVIFNASRNIMTGSYYGNQASDFQVNLVDQVTAGMKIGYVLGVDGLPNVIPGIGANLMAQRSYVHVRPIPSMEAADKKKWEELWIPKFMKNLGGALDQELTGKTPEEMDQQLAENLGKFLDDLKESETFTITDSLSLGAQASLTVPLAQIMGIAPLSFMNTIVFGANANTVILRRTTFTRENGLIKVYLQNIQSGAVGTTFDFNFWMNIMRISSSRKWGEAKTRAFHLDEKPSDPVQVRKTVLAVRGVLVDNNSELLESNFNPYELDHETQARISQGKFLFYRWSKIEESHKVKVRPPKSSDPSVTFDPAKFERTLFSHRILDRSGKNYYAFLSDILDGLVQNSSFFKPGLLDSRSGDNPKDSFLGSSRWTTVGTEAEITPGRESAPVTIVEHFWAGWDLSKASLFGMLDQIDARVQSLGMGYSLVDRKAFNDMLRLQLYEVRTTFIIYDEGMKRLRDRLLIQDGSTAGGMRRLTGWDSFSGTDKDIINNILIPIYGQNRYARECQDKLNIFSESAPPPVFDNFRGNGYECILPWMKQALNLRRQFPADREGQVKWATRVMTVLERNADLGKLMQWIGKENFFFQVKISGFRTRDENGDTADYKSSTIGTISTRDRAGIFKDFISDYEITSSELNASYLTEGY